MSTIRVREYLHNINREDLEILEFPVSSATVELAAKAVGVEPGIIAKSLSFKLKEGAVIVVLSGTARLSNHKFKEFFGCRAKMLKPEETEEIASGNLGGSSQPDLGSTAQTTVTEEVLYQDEPAIDSSYDAIAPVAQQLQGSTEQEDWKLYLLILLALAVVVLEVVRIIRIRGTQKDEPDDNDGSI